MLLVIFAATFHARLRTFPSLTAFGAAAIVAACTLVQVAVFHTLAFRTSPDPTRVVVLNDLQAFVFQVMRNRAEGEGWNGNAASPTLER
ncbi:MAG TPA: hypothetical protein VK256_12405 [Candidatus Eisenbacteria bacterium]|nr:hypothetical protein [Candidatus Eisenbacteria bacterium]